MIITNTLILLVALSAMTTHVKGSYGYDSGEEEDNFDLTGRYENNSQNEEYESVYDHHDDDGDGYDDAYDHDFLDDQDAQDAQDDRGDRYDLNEYNQTSELDDDNEPNEHDHFGNGAGEYDGVINDHDDEYFQFRDENDDINNYKERNVYADKHADEYDGEYDEGDNYEYDY